MPCSTVASLNELIETWGEQWPSEVAHIYAFTGDSLSAFTWLDKAVEQGEEGLSNQQTYPHYDSLRQDPRWAAFLERTGTSESSLASIPFEVKLPGTAK